jgi:hypothetical protein
MKISMTGQEKGDLFIQVTAWADLTVSEAMRNALVCFIYKNNFKQRSIDSAYHS